MEGHGQNIALFYQILRLPAPHRHLMGAHAVLKQSGVIYHAPPSGFWGLKYGLVAQLGERSVRIRKVEGSTPFESIKRRIVLNDTAFLFVFLCKIAHHSS